MSRGKGSEQDPYERAVEMLWDNAKYLLIFAGPQFAEDASRQPFASEFCTPVLVEKPNKFMGFWGEYFNRYVHEKSGHDGFSILHKWRCQFFDPAQQDLRQRQKMKKKGDDEDGAPLLPRCYIVTCNIDGWFGRVGFDPDQMYEMWGNIGVWQCSGLPDDEPCCSDSWQVDRSFKFAVDGPPGHLDPRNEKKEAAAFQEVRDDRDPHVTPENSPVDSEEDADWPDEQQQRRDDRDPLVERLSRATVLRVTPALQSRPERYPDHFVGYPKHSGDRPAVALGLRHDARAGNGEADDAAADVDGEGEEARPAESRADAGRDESKEEEAVQRTVYHQPYLPMPPLSHELQHIRALSRHEYQHLVGSFNCGLTNQRDEKNQLSTPAWLVQRRRVAKRGYEKQVAFHNHFGLESEQVKNERQRYIWYNLSVRVVDDDLRDQIGAEPDSDSDEMPMPAAGSGVGAARVLYDSAQRSPRERDADGRAGADGEGAGWFQGKGSRYYFSNVPACDCYKDPDKNYHDVVQVPVEPLREPQLPLRGRVSTVVEMVVGPKPSEMPKPSEDGPVPPVPHPYRRIVWQMVGRINLTNVTEVRAAEKGKERQPLWRDDEAWDPDDMAEHVIEASARTQGASEKPCAHIFKIGVSRTHLRRIRYFEWEMPCEEEEPSASPEDAATVRRRHPKRALDALKAGFPARKAEGASTRPVPNHQLCKGACHGIARPRVRMVPRDNPRGHDKTLLPIASKPYQDWQKMMLKDITGGGSATDTKGLLILEMGCTKKMDPVRREADKIWKKCKANQKNCYIRVSEFDLETKKKGGQDSDNFLVLPQSEPKEALKRMERLVSQRLHKERR